MERAPVRHSSVTTNFCSRLAFSIRVDSAPRGSPHTTDLGNIEYRYNQKKVLNLTTNPKKSTTAKSFNSTIGEYTVLMV